MAKPWEKYGQTKPAAGPWERYGGQQPAAAPVEQPPVPTVGGMGGFNPMLARVMGGTRESAERAGINPENLSSNQMVNALGMAEAVPAFASGALALPASGVAGIVSAPFTDKPAADVVRYVQDLLTYQPRSGTGAGMTRTLGAPFELYGEGTNKAGEFVTDVTGSPAAGAFVKTAGDIAPSVIGARSGARPAPRQTGKYAGRSNTEVPTTEQLTRASKEAYKVGEESGVIVPKEAYAEALTTVTDMVKKEGINPKLHPKSSAVMKELQKSAGKPLTLQEAETLRKIAMDAEDDLNPVTRAPTPDARLAGKIVDELDASIDALSTDNPARALWSRSRKSQMIDQMIHRAEIKAGAHYTQAGMEHALRQEFKQLALNPRRMRGLTKEQRAAVEKVAKGGPLENSLRVLGKFDPTTGGMGTAVSVVTGAGLAPVTGGASMALLPAGFAAKRLATRATVKNVEKARESLVGRGVPSVARPSTTNTTQPSAAARGSTGGGVRSAATVRNQIDSLVRRASNLSRKSTPDSPQARAIWQELERLQAELASAEAREAAQRGPSGNQGK